jgi:hypothetical protein
MNAHAIAYSAIFVDVILVVVKRDEMIEGNFAATEVPLRVRPLGHLELDPLHSRNLHATSLSTRRI